MTLRFVAWINILLEVIAMKPELGYGYEGGEDKYAGHAFCDDGLFAAESTENLQQVGNIVSAFCELFKVKINANKSYYTISRGKRVVQCTAMH